MLRSLNKILCLLFLSFGLQGASAFSLLGAFDDWQTPETGFQVGFEFEEAQPGGSKDIGEEFRLNTPTITYGFDSTFLDYFGAEGVKAVDKAFAIINKLPPVSRMSTNLSEFLLQDAQLANERAGALNLIDLKSYTLGLILEQMGLSGEEHVFDLQKRVPFTSPIACQFSYQVVMRNFDPVSWNYSHYVNGALYTYDIVDFCPVIAWAFAVEATVDPTSIPLNAVASFKGGFPGRGLRLGGYYLNITRDDAGGLRYIYRKNNLNNEVLPANSIASAFSGPWQPVNFFQTNSVITNSLALRAGIEKISFRKTSYNSLFGTVFRPIVQSFTSPVFASTLSGKTSIVDQKVRRVVFRPDILFTAGNLNFPAAGLLVIPRSSFRGLNFLTNGLPNFNPSVTSVGPGTIDPQTIITFHKASPQFYNATPFFLNEDTALNVGNEFRWGSFDGSTNDPVVFPQGTSIRDLESQVLSRRF